MLLITYKKWTTVVSLNMTELPWTFGSLWHTQMWGQSATYICVSFANWKFAQIEYKRSYFIILTTWLLYAINWNAITYLKKIKHRSEFDTVCVILPLGSPHCHKDKDNLIHCAHLHSDPMQIFFLIFLNECHRHFSEVVMVKMLCN